MINGTSRCITLILAGAICINLWAGEQTSPNKKVFEERLTAVRGILHEQGIDCFIVTASANVTYITGFHGGDSWAMITSDEIYLLTDSKYLEEAQSECPYCKIVKQASTPVATATELLKNLKSVKTAAVEDSMSVGVFDTLKKDVHVSLKVAADVIEPVRARKNSGEVEAIRTAARIASQALRQTVADIKPGITENEAAGLLEFQMRELGAKSDFETIVAFGPNASQPHHTPGNTRLKADDSVLIDFGVKYDHYSSDITRCFTVGQPSDAYKKVYKAVQEAHDAAIRMIRPGIDANQVDAAARKVIEKYGFPVYGHGTGHGLGLQVHEQPFVSANNKKQLQAGMVLTIEPGVYIPGKVGVRIEDDILVTENGCEVLSNSGSIH